MGNNKSSSSKMMEEDHVAENDVSTDYAKLFLKELKVVFWAENRLAKLFQKMRKAAVSDPLKDTLAGYLDSIKLQLEKQNQIFEILGETPRAKKSELMAALAEEAKEAIEHKRKDSALRDVRIISIAQKIQHHKIASYGSLIQLAATMGNEEVISVLEEALSDEKQAVGLLNSFGESNTDPAHQPETGKPTPKEPEEQEATVYESINLTGKRTEE